MLRIPTAFRGSTRYGWVIVVLAALAMVGTLPARTHGLGMITERLLADASFQLDRIAYADMNLWATLLGALFCLPCGWLIDRLGLRITLAATVAALGTVVLWMTWLSGWWLLVVAIVLTRGFGQSALSVISITMVGKWFSGRLSLPMAVYSLLLSLGFALAAQGAKPLANADWRVLWGGMGWILLAGMAPLFLLLVRDPAPNSTAPVDEPLAGGSCCEAIASGYSPGGFTLSQAMQTQAFWVFGLAISVVALIGSGLSLFNESVLKQQGFPAEVFYNLITLTGIVGLAVKLPVGWLGQRWALNRLLAAGLLIQAACLLWFPRIHSVWEVALYGVGLGVSGTITTVLFFTIWGQAYGRAHLGQIQATAQMLTVLASAAGPKVFAECFARSGSYAPIFQLLAGTVALLAVWSLLIRVPAPHEAPLTPLPLTLAAPQEN